MSNKLITSYRSALVGAGVATAAWLLVSYIYRQPRGRAVKVLPSPMTTYLPSLSDAEVAALPYPPDILSGGRNIRTPYGNVRAYEWGNENGRRVLFVHGISTPAPVFKVILDRLVAEGCRVMVFDYFGRGYSDAPADIPLDMRLMTSQILLVLQSSPVEWRRFTMVGYSMGGAISATFTSYFPHLVEDLVLIAPGGLIRPHVLGMGNKIRYSVGFFPERLLEKVVSRHLAKESESSFEATPNDSTEDATGSGVVAAEVPASGQDSIKASMDPKIDVSAIVSWQIKHHSGFVPAFMSSIRYAPVAHEHEHWRQLGQHISAQKKLPAGQRQPNTTLNSGKVLIILGRTDPIIIPDELIEDAEELVGKENLHTIVMDAGHEVASTRGDDIADAMLTFWKGT